MANEELQTGDDVILTVRVRAHIVRRSDAHGLCYQVALEPRDYQADTRTVWLDPDEIVTAEPQS